MEQGDHLTLFHARLSHTSYARHIGVTDVIIMVTCVFSRMLKHKRVLKKKPYLK